MAYRVESSAAGRRGEDSSAHYYLELLQSTDVRRPPPERSPELERYIKENHSYDTPEIIALPILWGSQEYIGWVTVETQRVAAS